MAKRPDLNTLFLKGSKLISEKAHRQYSVSYAEILHKAKRLIAENNFDAAAALHTVYTEITGHSHLKHLGTNAAHYEVYTRTEQYKPIAKKLLPKLEKVATAHKLEREKNQIDWQLYNDTVKAELTRGADPDDLREIGYNI